MACSTRGVARRTLCILAAAGAAAGVSDGVRPLASGAGLAPVSAPALAPARVVLRLDGLTVTQPTYQGLDVIGARHAERRDRAGRLRWRTGPAPTSTAAWRDLTPTPTLSAQAALAAAFPAAGAPAVSPSSRLVVLAEPDQPARLAWQVGHADADALTSRRAFVDAHTGEVVRRDELTRAARAHRARVYPVSPTVGPLTEVSFDDLPAGATTLADAEVAVLGCIDDRGCRPVRTLLGERRVHHCALTATARTGAAGDFLAIRPPADDTAVDDAFAEVQAYHHVKTALAAFRRWSGDPGFTLARPLTVLVNYRPPNLDTMASACTGDRASPASRLVVEDNAYFWPAAEVGPVGVGDRIVMHQGERVDWAYDGEVVYHEATHALMHSLTELRWSKLGRRGLDPSPGGLHEGFSDYLAAAITGNPDLASYAGSTEDGPTPLGSLGDEIRCDQVLTGEEHDESHPWSSALWALRRSLRSAARREALDAAVFRVIAALPADADMAQATALVLAEFEVAMEEYLADAGGGADDARITAAMVAAAPGIFAARGLPGCGDRVLPIRPGQDKASLYVRGPTTWASPVGPGELLPASMQFALQVRSATAAIKLEADESYPLVTELRPDGWPTEPDLVALVRPASPITWSWSGAGASRRGRHDAALEVPVHVARTGARALEVVIEGDFAPGTYHVQLATRGADWGLDGVRLLVADDAGAFGDGKTDDGGGSDDGTAGCATTRSGRAGLLLVLAAGLVGARRRKRVSDHARP